MILIMFYMFILVVLPDSVELVDKSLFTRETVLGPLGKVALVFVAHDRPECFRDSMASVFAARGVEQVDVIVSMDYPAQFDVLESVVSEFASFDNPVTIWYNVMPGGTLFFQTSDDRITYHHKLIFNRVFPDYDYAIIVESDLKVSPDIIEYMFSLGHLLHPDAPESDSLVCVSAWNDNGMDWFTLDESRLFRTDFFPGLGWMIHRSMWTDILVHEWPGRIGNYAYDIWMREGASTRKRHCIVSEVSRTHHFSKVGSQVSGNSYTWYDRMLLASGTVPIPAEEIALVSSVAKYEERVKREAIENAKVVPFTNPFKIPFKQSIIVVVSDEIWRIRKMLGLTPLNYYKDVHEEIRTFNANRRATYKGLHRVTIKETRYGGTNITTINQSMLDCWGVLVN